MRVEYFVAAVSIAFTLENAMAAPTELKVESTRRGDMQATELVDSGQPPTKEEESRADAPGTDELRFCALDGCEVEHQGCVCSNTGWNGYCGWGPHHPGCLYCRCD